MNYRYIMALIYAHHMGWNESFDRIVEEIAEIERERGYETLADDILDANKGILHTGADMTYINLCILSGDNKEEKE